MILTTLHVDLGREWRGGQNQALLLAAELRRMGHTAELVASASSPLALRARAAGITVHEVANRLQAAFALRRLRGFNVVHCHEGHALTAALMAGVRPVVSRRVAYPISRLHYRLAKRIVAVSQFVKASVLACGFADKNVEVIYDGVTPPDEMAQGTRGLLGCIGWLIPDKGQELLIRAMPAVLARCPGCRMILAGDGPERPFLECLAAELEVTAACRFAGMVDDVAAVYRSLDVFVFPSIAEPLGSSLLAAMAHGRPCVALSGGAVPEVIEDGVNGLLVNERDPATLATAILRLLDDRDLAARLGVAARGTIEQRFTVARMASETVELYRRLLRSQ
ncbi:MAG TPA: glycosyltransferase family 4 protein [Bryobacteraceae bacterium]|nr:glycosyltransferase family 4 protein [Bryobacteraceae bacterium]